MTAVSNSKMPTDAKMALIACGFMFVGAAGAWGLGGAIFSLGLWVSMMVVGNSIEKEIRASLTKGKHHD